MSNAADLHPGGFPGLLKALEKRQRPLENIANVLPAPDCDLAEMFVQLTPPPPGPHKMMPRGSAARKWIRMQDEFDGQPEILHLHAMLIAIARRTNPPAEAQALFHRIWEEHGAQLVSLLTVRWQISAATTFSDIGKTGDQRACGMALSVLFDMIKLHDSERRLSGQPGRKPFQHIRSRKTFPVAFGMPPYAIRGGDLDQNLLARIWQLCERDATIAPLGKAMLSKVMTDPRSIFARIQELKRQLAERNT